MRSDDADSTNTAKGDWPTTGDPRVPGKFQTGGPCELILTAGCALLTVRFVGTVTCYLTR